MTAETRNDLLDGWPFDSYVGRFRRWLVQLARHVGDDASNIGLVHLRAVVHALQTPKEPPLDIPDRRKHIVTADQKADALRDWLDVLFRHGVTSFDAFDKATQWVDDLAEQTVADDEAPLRPSLLIALPKVHAVPLWETLPHEVRTRHVCVITTDDGGEMPDNLGECFAAVVVGDRDVVRHVSKALPTGALVTVCPPPTVSARPSPHVCNPHCTGDRHYPTGEDNPAGWDKLARDVDALSAEELVILGLRRIDEVDDGRVVAAEAPATQHRTETDDLDMRLAELRGPNAVTDLLIARMVAAGPPQEEPAWCCNRFAPCPHGRLPSPVFRDDPEPCERPADPQPEADVHAENEVCPSCGCYEHCIVHEGPTHDGEGVGKQRVCDHCDGERPPCPWSEANLAEQYSAEVRAALTFYPHLPASQEAREELADCGFLDDFDHEWTSLGERVALAIRGRQASRYNGPPPEVPMDAWGRILPTATQSEASPCVHATTKPGPVVPLPLGGSYLSEVCTGCGAWRMLAHNPRRPMSDWRTDDINERGRRGGLIVAQPKNDPAAPIQGEPATYEGVDRDLRDAGREYPKAWHDYRNDARLVAQPDNALGQTPGERRAFELGMAEGMRRAPELRASFEIEADADPMPRFERGCAGCHTAWVATLWTDGSLCPRCKASNEQASRDLAYAAAWQAVWTLVEVRGGDVGPRAPGTAEAALKVLLRRLTAGRFDRRELERGIATIVRAAQNGADTTSALAAIGYLVEDGEPTPFTDPAVAGLLELARGRKAEAET